MLKKKRGQTALEYTLLMIIVIGAFLAMQSYIKRGLQGRWKESIDQLGEQYDPQTADTHIRQTMTASTNTQIMTLNIDSGYWTMRTDNTISTERKTGYTSVGVY